MCHFIFLFPQYNALFNHSSQYQTQTSILSFEYHLLPAFTIAHHLSSTTQTHNHSKSILVQK
ncbi:hypothetical protein HOF65_02390 [bacterium]|nr:hypothetical protein [bacterium]